MHKVCILREIVVHHVNWNAMDKLAKDHTKIRRNECVLDKDLVKAQITAWRVLFLCENKNDKITL